MSGKNAQLSARTVTAGDEVRVIPGGHRPAIIGSINPVSELQQTGMGDGRTHVCARGLAPKESEREQGSRLGAGPDMEKLNGRTPTHSRLSDLDANYANYA